MNNLAKNLIPIHSNNVPDIRTGSVISTTFDDIIVNMAGKSIKAKKAFSCITNPQPNDIIICAENEDGMVYILGIIERPGAQKMSISFPSEVDIRADQGSINIHSTKNVAIASKNMNCFSKRAIHKSQEAIISYDNITANGSELQASFKTVRLISNLINTMAKQVIDKFKGYIKCTEDNDMVKSGQMNRQADGLYSMDSKYTIMNSKKSTKIDGEKILMG